MISNEKDGLCIKSQYVVIIFDSHVLSSLVNVKKLRKSFMKSGSLAETNSSILLLGGFRFAKPTSS